MITVLLRKRWQILTGRNINQMKVKELELLSEALWESIKSDLKFFAPIQVFVKKLSEVDFSQPDSLLDIKMYSDKIEEFFLRYRPRSSPGTLYFPPAQTSTNAATVKRINIIVQELYSLSLLTD